MENKFNSRRYVKWQEQGNTQYNNSIYEEDIYGYPIATQFGAYAIPSVDVVTDDIKYMYNIQNDTMELVSLNGKGKAKIKKISNGFNIKNVKEVYNTCDEIVFAIVEYNTRLTGDVAVIPGADYIKGTFAKYFESVIRHPGCSKTELNSLIEYCVKVAPKGKELLLSHQGLIWDKYGRLNFADPNDCDKKIEKYVPSSVLKRKVRVNCYNDGGVIKNWDMVLGQYNVLKFLGIQRIMSEMLFFLNNAGIYVKDYLCIKPSNDTDGVTKEKLIAMLSTNDFHRYPIPTLKSRRDVIEKECSEVYDGIFLVEDDSFADESDNIIDGLKTVIRCTQKREGAGRNIAMIISRYAGYSAAKLAPESAIFIDTEGIRLEYSADEIERVTDEMTSFVYSKALQNPGETHAFFAESVNYFRKWFSECYNNIDKYNTVIGMLAVEKYLCKINNISCDFNEVLNQYMSIIDYKGEKVISANMSIKKETGSKLSDAFRSKTIRSVKKTYNMRFDDDGMTAVISGNRLWVSLAILRRIVCDMNSTHSVKSIIEAFKNDGELICTDGDTHPFDTHDSNGNYKRLYFYDIPADILDDDVLYIFQNPETAAFMLDNEETKISGFMPLLITMSGKVAGKLVRYNSYDNDNTLIVGQSGRGKTHTECQLMAARLAHGYEVWAFDTSDSFTYEAMCDNLSRKYVDSKVVFHNLDNREFDYDIFYIDRNGSRASQKKKLLDIIIAGIGELTNSQTNILREKISDLLDVTDEDKTVSPDDLLILLDEKGFVYESLRSRLMPFFNDAKEYGLTGITGTCPFSDDHKIHIIRINESGNQIVDAMLASFFERQRESSQRQMSIFLDEVQNHSFTDTSPIKKIMKEGRKYRLSLVVATQDFYARRTDIGSILGKADTIIFHQPTQNSACLVADELRWNKSDMARFDTMDRGDVIIKGYLFNKEQGCNVQKILSGHIYDFPLDEYSDEEKIREGN